MSDKISDKELQLAVRVNELNDAAALPGAVGGGLLGAAANFLLRRVSRGFIAACLLMFTAYHGWEAFNGALQSTATLQNKRAERDQAIARANAYNTTDGEGHALALQTMLAEIEKVKAQAAATQAEADAQNAKIGDSTVRLRTMREEIANTQAEAKTAAFEANAQTQLIDNMPAAVALKKAEVETLEQQAQAALAKQVEQVGILKFGLKNAAEICSGGLSRC